jgi:hypothetical protein
MSKVSKKNVSRKYNLKQKYSIKNQYRFQRSKKGGAINALETDTSF